MDREIDIQVRRRRTARRVAIAVVAVAVGAGLLALASEWLRPSISRARARFGTVVRGDLEAVLTASGTVIPASERVISSPVEARIERFLKQPGEQVREGDAILELDTSATRLQLERLQEQRAQNENDRVQQRLELDDTIAELESQIETQRLDLEIAQYRLEQTRKLRVDGLISEEAFKETEVEVKKATIQLRRLEEEVAAARRTHEARLQRLGLDAKILDKEIDDERHRLELATTRSPIAGVLTWIVEDQGATVQRGEVLARIADLESFRVEASVSDAYASRLKVGQPVRVLVDDQPLTARLSRILPTVEAGAVRFDVELEQPRNPTLRHNLRVDVLVVTDFRKDALKAPRGPYVQSGGDRHEVFVVRGDRAYRTEARFGLIGHEYYEVLEGLDEGDEIILSDLGDYLHASELRLK